MSRGAPNGNVTPLSLGLVFELDHILNRTFRLNFMSKNIVNHFLIKIRYLI